MLGNTTDAFRLSHSRLPEGQTRDGPVIRVAWVAASSGLSISSSDHGGGRRSVGRRSGGRRGGHRTCRAIDESGQGCQWWAACQRKHTINTGVGMVVVPASNQGMTY
jgi:hypothetical protein